MFSPHASRIIPILMATQHPDNASTPFWSDNPFINTSQETQEIFESFSTLNCDEYMWDWEGKFADEAMIEKLMANHHEHFKKEQVGQDRFVTLRIPNIWEEKTFKLARAYMSVLSAAEFMDSLEMKTPPVFELILPMTRRANQLIHIQKTFRETAKLHESIFGESRFGERYIHIIPLIESIEDLTNSGKIVEEFLKMHHKSFGFKPPYLRTFIARSDPALNAGFVPAVVVTRMALREFHRVSKEQGIPIYPIIGTGSLPFRGGINPKNIKKSLAQYEGTKTVTVQSAFRYDYPLEDVKEALDYIRDTFTEMKPVEFDNETFNRLSEINTIFKEIYRGTIEIMAPMINHMSKFIPGRRERVQHIGLFGYSRGIGDVRLPRAIKFTAACYSLGIPPEFIGTGRGLKAAQEAGLLDLLKEHFFTLESELKHAGKFLNREVLDAFAKEHEWARQIQEDVELCESILGIELGPKKDHHFLHRNLTSSIYYKQKLEQDFTADVLEAAVMRKSLG